MTVTALIFFAMAGAVFGSFAVTAGLRVAGGQPWIGGRSRCDHCAEPIPYRRSIPVVSYALSRGRCGCCKGAIAAAHPIGEGLGATLLPLCLIAFDPLRGISIFVLAMLLLTASTIDLKTLRLPDFLTVGVAAASFALSASGGGWNMAAGLLAAGAVFLVLQGVRSMSRRHGADPGLGFGDVKLLTALALWLGIATPWTILCAAAAGLVAIPVYKPAGGRLPFGPFIAGGALIVGMLRDAGLLGLVA